MAFQYIIISVLLYSLLSQSSAQEVRLVGGLTRCQGRLEVRRSLSFARACNRIIGSDEARVICRELGCDPDGAIRSSRPEIYGDSNAITVFGITCTGNESSVSECRSRDGTCSRNDPAFAVAIECGGVPNTQEFMIAFSVISAILVIVSLLVVSWLMYYLITIRQLLSHLCYEVSLIVIMVVEIVLLLTTISLLITFAVQLDVFLAIASFAVSVVAFVWIVVLTPILVTVINWGVTRLAQINKKSDSL